MISSLRHIKEIITLSSAYKKDGRNLLPEDLSLIFDGAIVYDEEKILFVGEDRHLPREYDDAPSTNCHNFIVTPELVDSHTHLLFGGNRASEYIMRLNGADYSTIAKAGGGILYTMNETNQTAESELLSIARERIKAISDYGVGTIEIKSGYALTYEGELRLSRMINQLKIEFAPKVQIIRTFMAAHAVPKTFSSSKEYMDKVVLPLLHVVVKEELIDFVDIFLEEGYFTKEDSERLFETARSLGIKTKAHVDEFKDSKGAKLCAHLKSTSCEHLLCTTEDGIEAVAKSDCVAVLLPGTGFFLDKPQAKGRALLDSGAKVAIASDYNPGSCHVDNLLLCASMGAPNYKMNIAQLWASITLNAAHAVALKNQGAILEGLAPRFSFFKANSYSEISYCWGKNLAVKI